MTRTQQAILRIVGERQAHMTAEEIWALLKPEHPTASLSTVYRNLTQFAQEGRLRRIQRASGADYFERNTQAHDHAYCVHCGKVADIRIGELKRFLTANFAHPIVSFDLVINYVCPECAGLPCHTHGTNEKGD